MNDAAVVDADFCSEEFESQIQFYQQQNMRLGLGAAEGCDVFHLAETHSNTVLINQASSVESSKSTSHISC